MPGKRSPELSSSPRAASSCSLTRVLTILGVVVGLLSPIVYMLERNLESFYLFETDHLHGLAQRGIAAHGNDTRAVVRYITDELTQMHPAHINLDEEWIFSNAGGAMGGST
jgi:C-8 sterol isomerase